MNDHDCCGYHGHDHAHDHDCCGHHGHDHAHGHDCCDHHDHDHAHTLSRILSLRGGSMRLDSSTHEQASICTAVCQWPCGNLKQEEAYVTEVMRQTAAWVTEAGGFVGHIKSAMKLTEQKSFSITLDTIQEKEIGNEVTLELAAIVYGVAPEALAEQIIRIAGAEA